MVCIKHERSSQENYNMLEELKDSRKPPIDKELVQPQALDQ